MTKIKKLFGLSFFAFIALFSQTMADAAGYLKIEGIPGDTYDVQRIEAPPTDGNHLVATHKRSGNQIMLTARGGKIQQMFMQSASGKIKVLEATTAGCSQELCTTFQIKKCFIDDNGQCFCVCGAWFATDTGSSSGGDINGDGQFDISDLADGINIIAQTREHILLAVIMEKGRMTGMGSIDPKGGFHKFELDVPCGNYLAAPCRDGSKPTVYYDPYIKKCVGVCNDVIDLDPAGYQPINPYTLQPNGPCSDFIAQPCRKGTSMVIYYDAKYKKCVMICDY